MNEVNNKKQSLKKGITLFEAIIVLFIILFILWLLPLRHGPHEQTSRMKCASNLRQLDLTLHIYAYDYSNAYPTPEKWCDLIAVYLGDNLPETAFRCPAVEEGKCHYAINPNCEPNLPADTVLLFETKGGWNQFGGPELLAIDNHTQRGCNIGFNDGHVEFVKEEEIGDLKWSDEENNE